MRTWSLYTTFLQSFPFPVPGHPSHLWMQRDWINTEFYSKQEQSCLKAFFNHYLYVWEVEVGRFLLVCLSYTKYILLHRPMLPPVPWKCYTWSYIRYIQIAKNEDRNYCASYIIPSGVRKQIFDYHGISVYIPLNFIDLKEYGSHL